MFSINTGLTLSCIAAVGSIIAPGSAAATAEPDSLWQRGFAALHQTQRDLHRRLAKAVRALKAEGGAAAATLIMISLLYGIFHAVGISPSRRNTASRSAS